MNYTITINPENYDRFITLNPLTFSFRETMVKQLTKLAANDTLVVYLAQEMCWAGVFRISRPAYKSDELLYPAESRFVVRLEVEPVILPARNKLVEIKTPELWDKLERFREVNHRASGWIYHAKLASSLMTLSDKDTKSITEALRKAQTRSKSS